MTLQAIRNTFKIYERLKREQHIDTLFRTGKAFSVLQVRFIYTIVPRQAELSPARAGFSVPKKKFRLSVHRHRIRRLLVEAWRLNKHDLYTRMPAHIQLHLFIIYQGQTEPPFAEVNEAVLKGINKLQTIVAEQQPG